MGKRSTKPPKPYTPSMFDFMDGEFVVAQELETEPFDAGRVLPPCLMYCETRESNAVGTLEARAIDVMADVEVQADRIAERSIHADLVAKTHASIMDSVRLKALGKAVVRIEGVREGQWVFVTPKVLARIEDGIYMADRIAYAKPGAAAPVRRFVVFEGALYIGASGGGGVVGLTKATPIDQWDGATKAGAGRVNPETGYEGILVALRGETYVLSGLEGEIKVVAIGQSSLTFQAREAKRVVEHAVREWRPPVPVGSFTPWLGPVERKTFPPQDLPHLTEDLDGLSDIGIACALASNLYAWDDAIHAREAERDMVDAQAEAIVAATLESPEKGAQVARAILAGQPDRPGRWRRRWKNGTSVELVDIRDGEPQYERTMVGGRTYWVPCSRWRTYETWTWVGDDLEAAMAAVDAEGLEAMIADAVALADPTDALTVADDVLALPAVAGPWRLRPDFTARIRDIAEAMDAFVFDANKEANDPTRYAELQRELNQTMKERQAENMGGISAFLCLWPRRNG